MSIDPNKEGITIDYYQRESVKRDQLGTKAESISNSIANLAEEVGSLLRWYEQDRMVNKSDNLEMFSKKAPDKLGDMFWYMSSIANRLGISMETIAVSNLEKIHKRWPAGNSVYTLYDEQFPPSEQLPRQVDFYIQEKQSTGKVAFGTEGQNGVFYPLGNQIDDNTDIDDGYRFHDVLHLAYAAYLGWSPVVRAMFKHKRKSEPSTDVYEDGARARDLEEAVTAMIFEHAKAEDYFEDHTAVDFKILKLAERLTLTKEVSSRSPQHWTEAILKGYEVFRKVRDKKGGKISMDINKRVLTYTELTQEEKKKFFE